MVTGRVITGDVLTQSVNINISVSVILPSIEIIYPRNETYLTNESLLLEYSASNSEFVWYNIDKGNNITLPSESSQRYFNISEGSRTLFLFANNSKGTTSANVTFFVNLTKLIIIYEEYKGSFSGNSTDFIDYSYEEIQNLSDVILENTNYGKILFNMFIDITEDKNPGDNIVNIDNNTNLSFNKIELNSGTLPNFNKSSTLWIYNLSFSNPRILRNNEICSSDTCIIESYSDEEGILKFNVTGFSVYSSEETPVGEADSEIRSRGGSVATTRKIMKNQSVGNETGIGDTGDGKDRKKIGRERDIGGGETVRDKNSYLLFYGLIAVLITGIIILIKLSLKKYKKIKRKRKIS